MAVTITLSAHSLVLARGRLWRALIRRAGGDADTGHRSSSWDTERRPPWCAARLGVNDGQAAPPAALISPRHPIGAAGVRKLVRAGLGGSSQRRASWLRAPGQ
jgi:hypothetical protein